MKPIENPLALLQHNPIQKQALHPILSSYFIIDSLARDNTA
jgi:hypothetical protein